MKKTLSFVLSVVLMLSLALPALADYDYHDYSQFPLADHDVTIRISLRKDGTYSKPAEETWFWNWMTMASGLDFEYEQLTSQQISEKKNTMFAANDLPDIMIGYSFNTGELVKYGQVEGQLLALNDYITPEIMPYLYQWFEDYPAWKANCTAPDGNIYSFPCFNAYNPGNSERFFFNTTWLEECGKEVPNTLDEFIDVLYAMKAARPDSYPLGGGANGNDPRSFILNAMGFLLGADDDDGYQIALRNGEMVIPGGTQVYKDFLALMKQLYDDGIIHPSFFTMDTTAIDAMVAEDRCGAWPRYTYTMTPEVEKFQQWTSAYPLTSQWNDTKQWRAASQLVIGGCVLSADTEYAELLCRWVDFFYGDLGGLYEWNGPAANSSDCIGLTKGYVIDENGNATYVDVTEGTYESNLARNYAQMMGFFNVFGNRCHAVGNPDILSQGELMQMFYGVDEIKKTGYNLSNGDQHFRSSMLEKITPYETDDFPYFIYFDEDTTITISDLASVIKPFINNETAKFITGVRSLDEFDTYLEELNAMGFEEYLGYYQAAYEAFKAE